LGLASTAGRSVSNEEMNDDADERVRLPGTRARSEHQVVRKGVDASRVYEHETAV
jgi:hypothetical protein